ncbi:MAG: RNA polymerase sigma factor RpoD/SigA [Bacteroidia bacterium]|nr:RNA polymerase sigma factor RpoD/SigA [Bacteroidia bacterium]
MRQLKISKQVTNRESPSLDKYLHDISKVELLNTEDEVQLSKQIGLGDNLALEKMVNANLRFVVSVSKQYQNQGLSLSDLISEGNIGLIKAAKRFDETRGFKFISYAVWWIRQSILQVLAENARIVRLPMNRIGSNSKIIRTFSQLEQQFEREPTPEEIAMALELAPKNVSEIIQNSYRNISIDAPINQEEDVTLLDILAGIDSLIPDHNLIKESLCKEIEWAVNTLTYREAYILRHFFGLNDTIPESLEEISNTLGITRERVRQIKDRALKRLKNSFRYYQLQTYLGQ